MKRIKFTIQGLVLVGVLSTVNAAFCQGPLGRHVDSSGDIFRAPGSLTRTMNSGLRQIRQGAKTVGHAVRTAKQAGGPGLYRTGPIAGVRVPIPVMGPSQIAFGGAEFAWNQGGKKITVATGRGIARAGNKVGKYIGNRSRKSWNKTIKPAAKFAAERIPLVGRTFRSAGKSLGRSGKTVGKGIGKGAKKVWKRIGF